MKKGIKVALIIVITCIALGILSIMLSVILGTPFLGESVWDEKFQEINMQTNETIISSENIKKLSINHKKVPYDVIIRTTDEKDIRIKEVMKEGSEFARIEEGADGTLQIKASPVKVELFSVWIGNIYTEILLPRDYKGELEIEVNSADVSIEDALTLSKKVTISASSGEISVEKLTAEAIKLSANSGDVKIEDSVGEMNINTTSGEIYVANSVGDCEINSSSGDVTLDEVDGNFDISTTSGEVNATVVKGSGKVSTSSGDITLKAKELSGNLTITATSGEVYLKLPKTPGFSFKANATSGDINTFFEEQVKYNKKGNEAEGTIGSSNLKVKVNTSSGDITVEDSIFK